MIALIISRQHHDMTLSRLFRLFSKCNVAMVVLIAERSNKKTEKVKLTCTYIRPREKKPSAGTCTQYASTEGRSVKLLIVHIVLVRGLR